MDVGTEVIRPRRVARSLMGHACVWNFQNTHKNDLKGKHNFTDIEKQSVGMAGYRCCVVCACVCLKGSNEGK